jgi:uncharacterized protein (DUF427 family)
MDTVGARPHGAASHTIEIEPSAKRFRVFLGDALIADTVDARLLRETGHQPVLYFPQADVAMERLARTAHATHCPYKGDASYWTVSAGGRTAENAAWAYLDPIPAAAEIAGRVAFYWNKMDRWMEEDQALLGHPRDPHKRIDTLPSARAVRVVAKGRILAESRNAVLLYETGHPVRPYIPRGDVRMELLVPSATRTVCPYKGVASYYSARVNGTLIADVAWCYEAPFSEVALIKGMLAFYPERVDELSIARR